MNPYTDPLLAEGTEPWDLDGASPELAGRRRRRPGGTVLMEPRFERLTPLHGGTSSYRVWRGLRSQGTVEGFPSACMTAYWEARRPSGIAVMCAHLPTGDAVPDP